MQSAGTNKKGERQLASYPLSFVLITVIVIYVIIDVEYPRAGLIRLEAFDQALVDARTGMN